MATIRKINLRFCVGILINHQPFTLVRLLPYSLQFINLIHSTASLHENCEETFSVMSLACYHRHMRRPCWFEELSVKSFVSTVSRLAESFWSLNLLRYCQRQTFIFWIPGMMFIMNDASVYQADVDRDESWLNVTSNSLLASTACGEFSHAICHHMIRVFPISDWVEVSHEVINLCSSTSCQLH